MRKVIVAVAIRVFFVKLKRFGSLPELFRLCFFSCSIIRSDGVDLEAKVGKLP